MDSMTRVELNLDRVVYLLEEAEKAVLNLWANEVNCYSILLVENLRLRKELTWYTTPRMDKRL